MRKSQIYQRKPFVLSVVLGVHLCTFRVDDAGKEWKRHGMVLVLEVGGILHGDADWASTSRIYNVNTYASGNKVTVQLDLDDNATAFAVNCATLGMSHTTLQPHNCQSYARTQLRVEVDIIQWRA